MTYRDQLNALAVNAPCAKCKCHNCKHTFTVNPATGEDYEDPKRCYNCDYCDLGSGKEYVKTECPDYMQEDFLEISNAGKD